MKVENGRGNFCCINPNDREKQLQLKDRIVQKVWRKGYKEGCKNGGMGIGQLLGLMKVQTNEQK